MTRVFSILIDLKSDPSFLIYRASYRKTGSRFSGSTLGQFYRAGKTGARRLIRQ